MNWIGLEAEGYHRFEWNAGTIIEYWKGLGQDESDFNTRFSVRFGEWRHRPFVVYITGSSWMMPLPHIKTYDQLEQLYKLLKWQEPFFP